MDGWAEMWVETQTQTNGSKDECEYRQVENGKVDRERGGEREGEGLLVGYVINFISVA